MIELRTLGEVTLRVAGHAPKMIVDHPKRLAVFSYLVVCVAAVHQRETLLAMFWPDLTADRARNALRKVLHYVRATVGDDVILNHGNDAIMVDRSRIRCDATALELAAATMEDEIVMKLNGGEFLKGFHLEGSPEFDSWLESTRSRIRNASVRSALRMAQQLESTGQNDAAAEAAHQAHMLAPFDALLVKNVVDLLQRSGYAVRAIRVYDELARRLEVEMGDQEGAIAAIEESLKLRSQLQRQMLIERNSIGATLQRLRAQPA